MDAYDRFLGIIMMQESVECAGAQKHNGGSPVFIHCMVLDIYSRYSERIPLDV